MIAVDYSIIYWRFYHIMKDKPDFNLKNIAHLISDKLNALRLDTGGGDIIIAADIGKSFRYDLYAEYKGNRDAKPEGSRELYHEVLKILDNQFSRAHCEGLEADDICFLLAQDYGGTVVSEDQDMHQVTLMEGVELWLPFSKRYYEGDAYYSLTEKIMLGDKSDNIPRCLKRGIGPVTLKKCFEATPDIAGYFYRTNGLDLAQYNLNKQLCSFAQADYTNFNYTIK